MKTELIKNAIKSGVQSLLTFTDEHKPSILIGTGIAGGITAIYLTARGTIKAVRKYDEAEKKKGSKLTKKETVKECWKCYIPAASVAAVSATAVVLSAKESSKRVGALATALSLSETSAKEYAEHVAEIVDEETSEKIKKAEAQDKLDANPIVEKSYVPQARGGHCLCFEPLFSRYFWSDRDTLERYVNEINETLLRTGWVTYDEIWTEFGLEPTGFGDRLGYEYDADNSSELLKIHYMYCGEYMTGDPCIIVQFNREPTVKIRNY